LPKDDGVLNAGLHLTVKRRFEGLHQFESSAMVPIEGENSRDLVTRILWEPPVTEMFFIQ